MGEAGAKRQSLALGVCNSSLQSGRLCWVSPEALPHGATHLPSGRVVWDGGSWVGR